MLFNVPFLMAVALLSTASFSSANPTSTWSSASATCKPPPIMSSPQNCAAATILASGIALNIADQRQEQSALSTISSLLATSPTPSPAVFSSAKSNLLTFVNNGIAIRQANQLITPPGSPATAGLAIVANAQLEELELTLNLTGTRCVDEAIVSMLAVDFKNGIVQNEMNMAAATQGC